MVLPGSDSSDDSDNKSTNFYNKFVNHEFKKPPKSLSLTELAGCSKAALEVKGNNLRLDKPIKKISQKDKDKKKAIRLQKKRQLRKENKKKVEILPEKNDDLEDPSNYLFMGCRTNNEEYEIEEEDMSKMNLGEEIPETSISNKYIDLLGKKMVIPIQSGNCYLHCKIEENGSLFAALFPNTKLYIVGNYKLKLIKGNISIMGYKFKENEEHVIYSPITHSTISINVKEGSQVKTFTKEIIEDLELSYDWIQDLNIPKDNFVVIVKFSFYESNATTLLDEILRKKIILSDAIWKETLGVHLLLDLNKHDLRLQNEPKEWTQYMDKLGSYFSNNKKKIFVICGGKGVGKSTFLKYTLNKFLSDFQFSSVACIDLDPGQPEFSLPSCVTLTVCSKPLFGPSFSHHENVEYTYQKQIMVGDISAQDLLTEYLDICYTLIQDFKEQFSSLPLIINTMGFTATIGLDIMVDILRMTEPSHVISIKSTSDNKNYTVPLDSVTISTIDRGILLWGTQKELNYRFTEFNTVARTNKEMANKVSREVNIIGYLSQLWRPNENQFKCHTLIPPLIINWNAVSIHLFKVPDAHVFLAINASLVGLCKVSKEYLHEQEAGNLCNLQYKESSEWRKTCMCLGWGVVKGIDPEAKNIHIYTPLDQHRMKQVNLITMSNVHLPLELRVLLGDSPYLKKLN